MNASLLEAEFSSPVLNFLHSPKSERREISCTTLFDRGMVHGAPVQRDSCYIEVAHLRLLSYPSGAYLFVTQTNSGVYEQNLKRGGCLLESNCKSGLVDVNSTRTFLMMTSAPGLFRLILVFLKCWLRAASSLTGSRWAMMSET